MLVAVAGEAAIAPVAVATGFVGATMKATSAEPGHVAGFEMKWLASWYLRHLWLH